MNNKAPPKPTIYADSNIMRDVVERRNLPSSTLQELAYGGVLRLVIVEDLVITETFLSLSKKVKQELERGVPIPREMVMKGLKKLVTTEGIHLIRPNLEDRFKAIDLSWKIAPKFSIPDAADALHLAYAFHYRNPWKIGYFATGDERLLKKSVEIFKEYNIRIVRSIQLVPAIYTKLDRVAGRIPTKVSPCIQAILDHIEEGIRKPPEPELTLVQGFLRRCLRYDAEKIHSTFRKMRGYDPEETEAALLKFSSLVWSCDRVKAQLPHVCPYSNQDAVCEGATPYPEDVEEDNLLNKPDFAESKSSPFYYYIREVVAFGNSEGGRL